MKKIILALALIIISNFSFAQSKIESVLRKYKNDDNVVSLMYEGEKLNDFIKQNKGLKSKVSYLDVMVFKNNIDVSKTDIEKINALLKTNGYELLINIKSPEGKAIVHGVGSDQFLQQVFVQANSKEFSIYAILSGNIQLNEIATIASSLKMKELEALNILK